MPPFPGAITKIFSSKRSPFTNGRLFPLIAYRDGIPAGRIAAVINHSHNSYHQDSTGFFGFFDFIDDPAVSQKLFTEATAILKAHHLTTIRGPYSPTINDECGLLTDGFDSSPLVMMAYNSPYYLNHYEQLGLKSARKLFAFTLSADAQAPERVEKIVARVKRSTGIRVRNVDLKRLNDELKIIHDLFNRTLVGNWGFVPITLHELTVAADDLKAIIDPSLVFIAERDGIPIAFSLTLPDVNELMLRCKNVHGIWRILKFVWLLKTRTPKKARLALLGVHPEHRNSGIASLFYWETLVTGRKKYLSGELSWIDESNKDITRAIELMGGRRYKTYQIFEAPL